MLPCIAKNNDRGVIGAFCFLFGFCFRTTRLHSFLKQTMVGMGNLVPMVLCLFERRLRFIQNVLIEADFPSYNPCRCYPAQR